MVVPVARMSVIRPIFNKQTYTQQVTELEPYSLSLLLNYVQQIFLIIICNIN
jgi:hypothetical protein